MREHERGMQEQVLVRERDVRNGPEPQPARPPAHGLEEVNDEVGREGADPALEKGEALQVDKSPRKAVHHRPGDQDAALVGDDKVGALKAAHGALDALRKERGDLPPAAAAHERLDDGVPAAREHVPHGNRLGHVTAPFALDHEQQSHGVPVAERGPTGLRPWPSRRAAL